MSNVIGGKILIPISFGAYASLDYPFIVFWGHHVYRPFKIPFYYDKYSDKYNYYYYPNYDSQSVVPTEYISSSLSSSSLSSSTLSSSPSSYESYGDNQNNEILESERQAEGLYYYDRNTNDKTSPTSQKDDQSYKNDNYQTSFYDNIKYTQPDYNTVKKNKSNSMYSQYNYKMPEVTNSHYRKRLHKESTYKYKPNVHKLKKFGYNDQYKASKTVYTNDNLRKYHNNNRKVSYQSSKSNDHHHIDDHYHFDDQYHIDNHHYIDDHHHIIDKNHIDNEYRMDNLHNIDDDYHIIDQHYVDSENHIDNEHHIDNHYYIDDHITRFLNKNNDKSVKMNLKYYNQLTDDMSKLDNDNKNNNKFNYRKYQNPKRVYKKPTINSQEMLNDVYEKRKLKNGDKKRREEYSNDRNNKLKPDNEKNYIDTKTNYDEGINRKAPKNKMGKSEKKREYIKKEVHKEVKHPSEDDVSVIKVVNEYA
ncbi:unnamed protein product [Schistosoma margrebowiei]|uniref:Uncharacterized protein n=1 Tax=Schistosoma margrebowiei TaxID=48269 RepID=A0A183LH97_9TREM|nr:unnamed protein product [Schistosoma margrebowiei]